MEVPVGSVSGEHAGLDLLHNGVKPLNLLLGGEALVQRLGRVRVQWVLVARCRHLDF